MIKGSLFQTKVTVCDKTTQKLHVCEEINLRRGRWKKVGRGEMFGNNLYKMITEPSWAISASCLNLDLPNV